MISDALEVRHSLVEDVNNASGQLSGYRAGDSLLFTGMVLIARALIYIGDAIREAKQS